ncbi:hypothetical protein QQX98_011368 [Neonectria punicea]|uniref:Uncharacterized protein n=1 Tax=Neonectria punicea TaxID=979145 RepID=A0ABR1GLW7_9HYPO
MSQWQKAAKGVIENYELRVLHAFTVQTCPTIGGTHLPEPMDYEPSPGTRVQDAATGRQLPDAAVAAQVPTGVGGRDQGERGRRIDTMANLGELSPES